MRMMFGLERVVLSTWQESEPIDGTARVFARNARRLNPILFHVVLIVNDSILDSTPSSLHLDGEI